jgi:hypothetical protein
MAVFAVALGLLAIAGSAQAQYDSGGFEPPRFLTNLAGSPELSGQDPLGPWLKDTGTGTAIIRPPSHRRTAVQFTRQRQPGHSLRRPAPRDSQHPRRSSHQLGHERQPADALQPVLRRGYDATVPHA